MNKKIKIAKLIGVSSLKLNKNCLELGDCNAKLYGNPSKDGLSIIVDDICKVFNT